MTRMASQDAPSIGVRLRGEPESLCAWIEHWNARRLALCAGVIFLGAGLYGAAMGYWRAPLQGLFVAIKFPLIILLTSLGNALLNAMLAPLLGLNLTLRQSFLAVLMSFTILAAILGSFSPLAAVVAFAGTTANPRLLQLLRRLSGRVATARRVLLAWLVGNLFFGRQLCWILRPFI